MSRSVPVAAALALAALVMAGPAAAAEADVVDGVSDQLNQMLASYEWGATSTASQERRAAYLLFEEVEASLRSRDPALTTDIERIIGEGGTLAALIQERAPYAEVAGQVVAANGLLSRARAALAGGSDPGVVFGQSLFIMVREGFEAILVVGAIAGYLIVSGNRDKLRTLYLFSALAVAASFATAAVFYFVSGLGAVDRELLEGATGLLAVIVLFYVSYWLLSKVEATKWMAFIKTTVNKALASGNSTALGLVSFLAVYREGFETVLFYQALASSAQTGEAMSMLVLGFLIGVGALAVVFVAFYKFGVKIPMREFFAVTGFLLYYLAFTFAGNAVHELQEAGVVGATVIAGLPTVDLIGFHPTVETMAAQLLLVAAAIFAWAFIFVVRPAADRLRDAARSGAAASD
ncbi:MAG TPA: FTR1 family protein [Candidatus Thermoplasmatota archaeon]